MRRPLRTLAGIVRDPRELTLALRAAAWTVVLPALKVRLPLPRLTRLMWLEPRRDGRDPARERRVLEVVGFAYDAVTLRRRDNCLERSLLLYRYLSREGAEPQLVTGMRRTEGGEWDGHAWLVVDGEPIGAGAGPGFRAVSRLGRRGEVVVDPTAGP